nr:hypothetical protein B0A51_01606 [Rachicladosporium sp. CCFEE 5018]
MLTSSFFVLIVGIAEPALGTPLLGIAPPTGYFTCTSSRPAGLCSASDNSIDYFSEPATKGQYLLNVVYTCPSYVGVQTIPHCCVEYKPNPESSLADEPYSGIGNDCNSPATNTIDPPLTGDTTNNE